MSETYGAMAMLPLWATPEMREQALEMLTRVLAKAGVTTPVFEERQELRPPTHSDEFPDCPYSRFGAEHPGVDEFPECSDESHWVKGGLQNAIYAFGEAVPA